MSQKIITSYPPKLSAKPLRPSDDDDDVQLGAVDGDNDNDDDGDDNEDNGAVDDDDVAQPGVSFPAQPFLAPARLTASQWPLCIYRFPICNFLFAPFCIFVFPHFWFLSLQISKCSCVEVEHWTKFISHAFPDSKPIVALYLPISYFQFHLVPVSKVSIRTLFLILYHLQL